MADNLSGSEKIALEFINTSSSVQLANKRKSKQNKINIQTQGTKKLPMRNTQH